MSQNEQSDRRMDTGSIFLTQQTPPIFLSIIPVLVKKKTRYQVTCHLKLKLNPENLITESSRMQSSGRGVDPLLISDLPKPSSSARYSEQLHPDISILPYIISFQKS